MNDLKLYFDTHYSGEEIEKLFSVSEVEGYVAEIDAVVVGYLRGQNKKEEKYYNIVSLYVLPEYQGRGIGHKLLSLAEKRTIELGEKEIWLGVMTQNKESVDWYKRVGFEFLKEEPFVMGSTTVPHLIGRKLVK
jgi:ribosomal protein S18 acetylase RimI-like enzyme